MNVAKRRGLGGPERGHCLPKVSVIHSKGERQIQAGPNPEILLKVLRRNRTNRRHNYIQKEIYHKAPSLKA